MCFGYLLEFHNASVRKSGFCFDNVHSASVKGEILSLLVIVPFTGRTSFVYSASLGDRVEFICYLLQPFLFSSWSGVSFVLIKFYSYSSLKSSY